MADIDVRQAEIILKFVKKLGFDPKLITKDELELLYKIISSDGFIRTGSTKELADLIKKFEERAKKKGK